MFYRNGNFLYGKIFIYNYVLYVKITVDLQVPINKAQNKLSMWESQRRFRCYVHKYMHSREVTETWPCPGELKTQCSAKGAAPRLRLYRFHFSTAGFLTGSRTEEASRGSWLLNEKSMSCAWCGEPELEPNPTLKWASPSQPLFWLRKAWFPSLHSVTIWTWRTENASPLDWIALRSLGISLWTQLF